MTGFRSRGDYWADGTIENQFGADDRVAWILEEEGSPVYSAKGVHGWSPADVAGTEHPYPTVNAVVIRSGMVRQWLMRSWYLPWVGVLLVARPGRAIAYAVPNDSADCRQGAADRCQCRRAGISTDLA